MANENGDTHKNPPPGDFESRIQFLLQSSESLHANLQELHERMDQQNSELAKHQKATDERLDKILSATENMLASVNKIGTVVQSHQDRLDKLDGGSQQ